MTTKEQIAKDLLSIKAVFLRPDDPFTWASGIKSPIYCDNRLTLSYPEVRNHVESALAELIRKNYPDAQCLMGTSTAGIAHAALTADILGLPMGYVRSSSKDHGRQNNIEGILISLSEKLVFIEGTAQLQPEAMPATPRYDHTLREAVRTLQVARGLPADGVAGSLTLMALANDQPGPRLMRTLD